jgi:hypothetical protein
MVGVEPLYIVDARTTDDTVDVLKARGADFHVVKPADKFGVTELIQAASNIAGTDWIVRLDDDEFPSSRMILFIDRYTKDADVETNDIYHFPREWVKLSQGKPVFFRSPRHGDELHYDMQPRLWRNANLKFDHQIHTVGVDISGCDKKVAPRGSFIVHFDALLKTPSQRLAKARRYEELQEGSAWYFTDVYLPDLYSDGSFQLCTDGFSEFADLFLDIPSLPSEAPVELRDDELHKITTWCSLPLKKSFWGRIATAQSAVRRALQQMAALCEPKPMSMLYKVRDVVRWEGVWGLARRSIAFAYRRGVRP